MNRAKFVSSKWEKENKTAKATQVAFELEQKIAKQIQQMATSEGLTTSSQIRKLVGLSYSPPKRPRLTVSLSVEDYKQLGLKYGIDYDDNLQIKRKIIEELINLFDK